MSATEILRRMLDERGVEWRERVWGGKQSVTTFWHARGVRWHYRENRFGELRLHADGLAPAQAIAATLGSDRVTLLEEKVKLQGDYIIKLTKEHNALFAQSCEAATRHAGQIDAMQRKLEAATLGAGTCRMELPDLRGPAFTDVYVCSECGGEVMVGTVMGESDVPKWCPWCGRKVVGA